MIMHLKSNSIVSTPWVQSNIKFSTLFKNTSECCLIAKCYKETLRASNMVRGSSPHHRENSERYRAFYFRSTQTYAPVCAIKLRLHFDRSGLRCTYITKQFFLRFYFLYVINVFHGKSNLNLITFNQAEIIILNYGV